MNKNLLKIVHVNVPFRMLQETYLDLFLDLGLNPEIGLDADALDSFSMPEMEKIANAFHRNERSITLHGPFLDLSPGSPDPRIRKVARYRFEQLIQRVPVFRPKSVVCHAGFDQDRYGFFQTSWFEKSLSMWKWLGEELRNAGTCLMLENVYEHRPDEMLPFFQALHPLQAKFCLDLGHQSCFGKVPLADWLEQLGPYLGQLHLHDNQGERDEHLPLGKGVIDFSPIIQALKNIDPLPILTLEPHEEKDLRPSLEYLDHHFQLRGGD